MVNAICARHQIALTRLYRILDRHRIPRRQPNAPKLPARLRRRILDDYLAGVDTEEIAHRHGVGHSTVSNVAARHGVLRKPHRSRDELVELIVRWFIGAETTQEERQAIVRVGCRTNQPGLRSLEQVDAAIADDVIRRLIDVLRSR
jgi:transposase-like protein